MVTLLLNAFLVLPYFWPQTKSTSTNALGVATLNVFTENTDYPKIIRYLRESGLDIVFLSEIEPALMVYLQELRDLYPYIYDESMEGTHGLAFISKYPFKGETILLDERHHRFLKASLEWQGQNIVVYAAHPHPPLAARWTKSRDDELSVIQTHIQAESKPLIFLGDFNASPWSRSLQQIFAQTSLFHGAKGFGIYPTWYYKTMLLSAPLDHILFSSEWKVISYETEEDIGSDHIPVVAKGFLP
jgi:endonuclease/exonuclease/phosphatase (EEP) superfamily protein YafD